MKFEEDYLIRLCKPEDAETDAPIIAPLVQEMIGEEGTHYHPEQAPLTDLIYSLLSTGFSEFVVAEVKDQPVGYLHLNYRLSTRAASPYGAIDEVYVQMPARSLGIERSMLDYACQRAHARGCAYVEMTMRSNRADGLRLYEQMGFERKTDMLLHCTLPRRGTCTGHEHE